MADVVLFGATGYTGKLTAHSLHEAGVDFAICGRDPEKLKSLASATGSPEMRVANASDVGSLVDALAGAKVLITCVGPFMEHGWTAVEAALRSGVHYLDSAGEGAFIDQLIERYDRRAVEAGIAIAPAMGFDEVPGDVATTLAAEGMEHPSIIVTYALPRTTSRGTAQSTLGIVGSKGPFLREGEPRWIRAGEIERWSPMPPPLGPRRALSFPLAVLRLAPRHLDVSSYETYVTAGGAERLGLKFAFPMVKALVSGPGSRITQRVVARLPEGPIGEDRNAKWTILAEARDGDRWRNVVATGKDVYGLTAETLTAGAIAMCATDYAPTGVIAPVQAVGLDGLQQRLAELGVKFDTYAPV